MRICDGRGYAMWKERLIGHEPREKKHFGTHAHPLYIPQEIPAVLVACIDVNVVIASPSLVLTRSSTTRMCRERLSRAARIHLSQRHVLSRCFVLFACFNFFTHSETRVLFPISRHMLGTVSFAVFVSYSVLSDVSSRFIIIIIIVVMANFKEERIRHKARGKLSKIMCDKVWL